MPSTATVARTRSRRAAAPAKLVPQRAIKERGDLNVAALTFKLDHYDPDAAAKRPPPCGCCIIIAKEDHVCPGCRVRVTDRPSSRMAMARFARIQADRLRQQGVRDLGALLAAGERTIAQMLLGLCDSCAELVVRPSNTDARS